MSYTDHDGTHRLRRTPIRGVRKLSTKQARSSRAQPVKCKDSPRHLVYMIVYIKSTYGNYNCERVQCTCIALTDLFRPVPTVAEHRPIPTLVGFNKVELGSDYDANRVGVGLPKSPLRRWGWGRFDPVPTYFCT